MLSTKIEVLKINHVLGPDELDNNEPKHVVFFPGLGSSFRALFACFDCPQEFGVHFLIASRKEGEQLRKDTEQLCEKLERVVGCKFLSPGFDCRLEMPDSQIKPEDFEKIGPVLSREVEQLLQRIAIFTKHVMPKSKYESLYIYRRVLSSEHHFSSNVGGDNYPLYLKNMFFGFGFFSSKDAKYNLHVINNHSGSLQKSMLDYVPYVVLIALSSSSIYLVIATRQYVLASFLIVLSLAIIFILWCAHIAKKYHGISLNNLIRFVFKQQDSIDSGVAYVYSLLKEGVHPSDIILHGYSWGGHVATEVLRIFEEKGIYLTLINNSSFGSTIKTMCEGDFGKVITRILVLLGVKHHFHPLKTVLKSKSPICIVSKDEDGVIDEKDSLFFQYKQELEDSKRLNLPNGRDYEAEGLRFLTEVCGDHMLILDSSSNISRGILICSPDDHDYSNAKIYDEFNDLRFHRCLEESSSKFLEEAAAYLKRSKLNDHYKLENVSKELAKPHIEFVEDAVYVKAN